MRIPVGGLVVVRLTSGDVDRTLKGHFDRTSWMASGMPALIATGSMR